MLRTGNSIRVARICAPTIHHRKAVFAADADRRWTSPLATARSIRDPDDDTITGGGGSPRHIGTGSLDGPEQFGPCCRCIAKIRTNVVGAPFFARGIWVAAPQAGTAGCRAVIDVATADHVDPKFAKPLRFGCR